MTTAEMVHRSGALFEEHATDPEEMMVTLEKMGVSDPHELFKIREVAVPNLKTLWLNGLFMGYVLAGGKL